MEKPKKNSWKFYRDRKTEAELQAIKDNQEAVIGVRKKASEEKQIKQIHWKMNPSG